MVSLGQSPWPEGTPGVVELGPEQYSQLANPYSQVNNGQVQTQTAAPVTALQAQAQALGINTSGRSGGGPATATGGNTKEITLSTGQTLLIDMDDGHVVASYGTASPDKYTQERQLQQERFAHEDASSERKYQQSRELRDTDPANDPWRQMMPRYTAPSPIQGPRGALDIMDPNMGQLINVRQPEAPPVRVVGGNLIVDPGANAAVYYNGNKGQATNVSGGPQMLYQNASFPSAMSQAEQIAGRIGGNRGQGGGGSPGGAGSASGGMGVSGGRGFGNPGGAFGGPSPVTNRFANPSEPISAGPMRPPWENPDWVDPFQQGGIPRPPWEDPNWVDPFGDTPSAYGRIPALGGAGYSDTAGGGNAFGPIVPIEEPTPTYYGGFGNYV